MHKILNFIMRPLFSLRRIVSLRAGLKRAKEALKEIQKYNRISNDLDAYIWEMARYGLWQEENKPNPKDYGISTKA